MPYKYSQQLTTDYRKYFKKRFNKDISANQANDYLDSLAGLFLLYAFPPDETKGFDPRSTARNDRQIASREERGNFSESQDKKHSSVISIKRTPTPKKYD